MSSDVINLALKLVKKTKNIVVGSVDESGYPNAKMMFNARVRDGIKLFYLTTNTSSLRAAQFRKNPKASLYFSDTRFFKGLMLTGEMEVLTDEKSKELIWRNGDEKYYPLGVTDPDYCVLKFTGKRGRYYSKFISSEFTIE
ncbi:pyridoxamine 5'-phosphate oxidase family protein [Sporolactobacillus shoreicorticis]|uniref:Pyridoxamine 5'-phosphate oxidase family protein n=1 Tax=Sporolactobacillus shoreicorticis TaxID=1923877 RepID=A0ABW5S4E3_9BACL|nr:pyridoxamine 5'-phosphate oxidase family protein [Sporolactobacillus shoreicorticis]MCO7125246.1 pyridoxamine 5'-phosphate oxidase family protein [Sporolactobacillus shoreicorticis]